MKVAVFDAHSFEKPVLEVENKVFKHSLTYFDLRLAPQTAGLAQGFPVVCCFAHDTLNGECLKILKAGGTQLIALRSAGFNHVDLAAAKQLGLRVVRVPAYSPYSVAEHAVCLLLALNRKIHRAFQRVRELNFSIDHLVGFDLHGKAVGVIGTGKIGSVFARIMTGFGCRVLAFDVNKQPDLEKTGVVYVEMPELLSRSDVLSLHVPLTPKTRHIINEASFGMMKPGVFLINTGRGALIDTPALIQNLKNGRLGAAGLDVYEEEENVFFQDLSDTGLQDDNLARLLTFPNVLITAHQAFLTQEALTGIARTTLANIRDFEEGKPLANEVLPPTGS